MSSESVENGLKDGVSDEINENHSKNKDESSVQESAAALGSTEGPTKETDVNENKEKESGNTTNGSGDKTNCEIGNQNDFPVEAKDEEKVSEVESEATEKPYEDLNQENKDSQPKIVGNTDIEKAKIDIADVETPAATDDGNASEKSKETSEEVASGHIGEKTENAQNVKEGSFEDDKNDLGSSKDNVANDVTTVKGREGLADGTDGVEGINVDNEVENKDKDEHLRDKDLGGQDDDKTAASTTESEVVESEKNETKADEGGSETVGEGKNDSDADGGDNIEITETPESKQDERKGSEIAESEGTTNEGKEVDEGHADIAAETSAEEKSESQTENQNNDNDKALVEKITENSSESPSSKETVETDGKDTLDKTAAVEETQKSRKGNQESESQISSPDDNKSEAPSGNIDDLIDDILAVTDDVDAGNKSQGNEVNDKEDEPEVASECSEKAADVDQPMVVSESSEKHEDVDTEKKSEGMGTTAKAGEPEITNENSEKSEDVDQPMVVSESSEKSEDVDQPMVVSESSEKSEDVDQPMVVSKSSEKNEGDGPVAGGSQEDESSAEVEQTSSDHLHARNIEDEKQGEQTERRGSGNTVYRVQTDYLTRQVIAKQEKEMYLEEKLSETSRDLEVAERKVKDLQLRLKRFVKDDEAKDQKMRQMEKEYKELTDQMQRIEDSLDLKSKNNNTAEIQDAKERQRKKSSSKVCVML